jgi:hypothetical protein
MEIHPYWCVTTLAAFGVATSVIHLPKNQAMAAGRWISLWFEQLELNGAKSLGNASKAQITLFARKECDFLMTTTGNSTHTNCLLVF